MEEYELDETNYDLKTSTSSFKRGEKCTLLLSAQTTNDLDVPDAEAEIFLLAGKIQKFHAAEVIVPDTLWQSKESLGSRGLWQVVIPDSLIPSVDLFLHCHVYFNNSSGQLVVKRETINFSGAPFWLNLVLNHNEIIASSNQTTLDSCYLDTYLFNDQLERKRIALPAHFPIDPRIKAYELSITGENVDAKLEPKNMDDQIECNGLRSADSIRIAIYNPRSLPIWYQIKTKSTLVEEGFFQDTLWRWRHRDASPDIYHYSYQYLWAGETKSSSKQFTHYPKLLNIKMDGPTRVSPGQVVDYQVQVKKSNGRPAKGIDLSAGAINAKFGTKESYSPPQVGFRRQQYPRNFPSYTILSRENAKSLPVTRFLVSTFQLKDSSFYQFRYTNELLYFFRDSSLQRDSFYHTVAQFAPFLFKGGKMQPIYLVYVNRKLVYYHDTQDHPPYSFAAPTGYNQIIIRSRNHEYVLDSIYLRAGEKLELALNEDFWPLSKKPVNISRTSLPDYFSPTEKNLINQKVFVIKKMDPRDSIFIWDTPKNIHFTANNGKEKFLGTPVKPIENYKIGPFPSGSILTYLKMNYFKKTLPFEPLFSYSIEKNRERLYAYQVFADLYSKNILLKNLPQLELGQQLISPKIVRAFSPKIATIPFDKWPHEKQKYSGSYQFEYLDSYGQTDSTTLFLVAINNLLTGKRLLLPAFTREFHNLPAGDYELLLFNRLEAVFRKKIHIDRDSLFFENLSGVSFDKKERLLPSLLGEYYVPIQPPPSSTFNYSPGKNRLIRGRITDQAGEGLIGVCIFVKGTLIGTITDIDGSYRLRVPKGITSIEMSYTGFITKELLINSDKDHSNMDFTLEENSSFLSEVVVTGYGAVKRRESTGSLTLLSYKLQGRVAGISIQPQGDVKAPPQQLQLSPTSTDLEAYSGLRQNFRDLAFWQPNLRSNRWGKAHFKVHFPDDITNWKVFVIGADKGKKAGLFTTKIQSFKPLMAQLTLPRFLIHGDKTMLSGKVLNYTTDTVQLRTYFKAGDRSFSEKQSLIRESLIEKTEFNAPEQGDSLQFTYALESKAGYTDGEQRKIALLPIGTLEQSGFFLVLEHDTVLNFLDKNSTIHFRIQPGILPLLQEDLQYLRSYPYDCNEQTASKLIGLLGEKQLRAPNDQSDKVDKKIRELIALLRSAQNLSGYWGWWPNSSSNVWMTNYVLQALQKAKQAGFYIPSQETGLRWLTAQLSSLSGTNHLQAFQTLILAGQKIDSLSLRDTLAKPQKLLCNRLLSWWIKQRLGYPFSPDSLFKYRKFDAHGGIFWEEEAAQDWSYNWNNNRLANTLLAYQICQKAGLQEELKNIRLHLLSNRGYTNRGMRSGNGWRNTQEVASVISTIVPDLVQKSSELDGSLQISGALEARVNQQVLEGTFKVAAPLSLSLRSSEPYFCSFYQENWNHNPAPKGDLFSTSSHFEQAGEVVQSLKFGKAAQLIAEVAVKKEGQYVMVEIPIPAGCSYGSKTKFHPFPEIHREYFVEKVSIFCEQLPIGKHRFIIELEPRFSGRYTLNPVHVEEMYFPVLYGRNGVSTVAIKP